jgi:hypothetical protein
MMGLTGDSGRTGRRVMATVALVVFVAGCGSGGGSGAGGVDATNPGGPPAVVPSAGGDGEAGGGGDGRVTADLTGAVRTGPTLAPGSGWPEAMPPDIPPYPGTANMMLSQQTETERGIWIRIFVSGVSPQQFAIYEDELRAAGYSLKGTVFYSSDLGETKADAERRAAAGDVDEITASKGNRLLTIGVPKSEADAIAFDIDGLTQAEADAITAGSI